MDPAYRYKCAIFCTQVLFVKKKHNSRLTSTAKAKRKQINELKTHILIVFLFFILTECFNCVRLEGSQQMFVVEFNLLTFCTKEFSHLSIFFFPPFETKKTSFWHQLLDSVYSPSLSAVLVLLYNAGLCSSFVHILPPSFLLLQRAHLSAGIPSFKSTFSWRESLDVSHQRRLLDKKKATEDCECSTHTKKKSWIGP